MDHHYHRENEYEYQEKHKAKTSKFNRSRTIHGPRNAIEYPEKPLYLYPPPSMERNGSIKKLHCSPLGSMVGSSFRGKVKKLCSIFDSRKETKQPSSNIPKPQTSSKLHAKSSPVLPGTEDRVVIYFTSIRGIRRTFEDCYTVRMIVGSYRVKSDERDVSMHITYRKELQKALGENNNNNVTLPQVFIKGKYIGGAEVIKQLNEIGELPKLLRGLPLRPIGYICEGCGDVRFLPCSICDGSRKIFDDDNDGQIQRCMHCNENGLVRCPLCSF